MRRRPARNMITLAVALLAYTVAPGAAVAQTLVITPESEQDSLQARVWLDRGEEPVVQPGDVVRVYYRTSADAWAAIFRIDTDGVISLVFPQHPETDGWVGGGQDYRLLFPQAASWRVDEDPGTGYFFMVASPEPLDFSVFGFDPDGGWDLSEVGSTVYEDPYVAIDDYVAAILPQWETTPYALDFLSYDVGETHEYPRFLCYDCHEPQSYAAWDPYANQCTTWQIVVWSDPYFLPRYRYAGTRVVYARPAAPRPRYGVAVRRAGELWSPITRLRTPPPRRGARRAEPARRADASRTSDLPRRGSPPVSAGPTRRGPATAAPPSTRSGRPTLQRRAPSSRVRARSPVAGPNRPSARPPATRRPGAARTTGVRPPGAGSVPVRGRPPAVGTTRPSAGRAPAAGRPPSGRAPAAGRAPARRGGAVARPPARAGSTGVRPAPAAGRRGGGPAARGGRGSASTRGGAPPTRGRARRGG